MTRHCLSAYLSRIDNTRSRSRIIYPAGRSWRTAGIQFAAHEKEQAKLAVMALWNAGMQPRFKSVIGHIEVPFRGPGGA